MVHLALKFGVEEARDAFAPAQEQVRGVPTDGQECCAVIKSMGRPGAFHMYMGLRTHYPKIWQIK